MAVTSGFFNSLAGDRKYNSVHMSTIFDGIIQDGVFMSILNQLMVTDSKQNNMTIAVKEGRCWFNRVWVHNDSLLFLDVPESEVALNRVDTVVVDIDSTEIVREGSIRIISGKPATNPLPPELIKSTYHNQYPLADIYIGRGVSTITQANITNRVGSSDCPFAIGVMKTMDIDPLIAQWVAEWAEFMLNTEEARKAFQTTSEYEFTEWFNNLVVQLDGNVAGNLQNQINAIIQQEFERYYSLDNKTTIINKNSSNELIDITETSDEVLAITTITRSETKTIITTRITITKSGRVYTKTTTIANLIPGPGKKIEENFTTSFAL